MARPKSIQDEDILTAARDVFLRDGPEATTAAIAREAGCSEGTIFNRFKTKHDLFLASMGVSSPVPAFEVLIATADVVPPHEALTTLAHRMIDFFTELLPRVHVVLARGESMSVFGNDAEPPPTRHIRTLIRYAETQQAAGRIAPMPPEVFARMFLGALHFYVFCGMTGVNDSDPLDRNTYVDAFVTRLIGHPEPS